jgi:hypothetical protein
MKNWPLIVTSVALSASLAGKVWLSRSLGQLTRRQTHESLAEGTVAPPITATALGDGRQTTIAFAGSPQPTVFYVFSPQCTWCAKNLENIKTLVARRDSEYRFIGLSLGEKDLRDHVERDGLRFPVFSGLSEKTRQAYRLGSTPQLIVVSRDGRVQKVWTGAFAGRIEQEIESFFGVDVPGIKDPAPGAL